MTHLVRRSLICVQLANVFRGSRGFTTGVPRLFCAEWQDDVVYKDKPWDKIHFDVTTEHHTNTNPTDARTALPEPMVNPETTKDLPGYEVTSDQKEWEYVLRVLRSPTFPVPPSVKDPSVSVPLPSGWTPPPAQLPELPYFVDRESDYLYPIKLVSLNRGQVKRTRLSQIDGNIWLLAKDLKEHLVSHFKEDIPTCVRELQMVIYFKGDHVIRVQDWLKEKGF